MLAFALTVSLLAAAPADASARARDAFTQVDCQGCRLLLAQAEAPAPSPNEPPPARSSFSRERQYDLERQIDDLNLQIRGIDTNWPAGYLVIAYIGYTLAPLLLLGLPAIIVGLVMIAAPEGLIILAAGIAGTIVGGAGLAMLIIGYSNGSAASEEAKARRNELINERLRLERELSDLRRGESRRFTPTPMIVLARF